MAQGGITNLAVCAFCGGSVEVEGRVGRLEECPSCGRDLHACLQCRFYDRSFHNQCRESQSGYVTDKERSNFCEFFELGRDVEKEKKNVEDAKEKLKKLFK